MPADLNSTRPPRTLRVLIIEDRVDDAKLMVRELERAGFQVDYAQVDSEEKMRRALLDQSYDVVLSDHAMPGFNAPAALSVLNDSGLEAPFLIVSGSLGEEEAVHVMKAGASDYVNKDHLSRLSPAVERELREAETRAAKRTAEESLKHSEALYRTLVDTSPDAILLCGLDSRIRMANPQTLRLLGWNPQTPPAEYLDRPLFEGDPSPQQQKAIEQILSAGRVENVELPIRRRDGTDFWGELSGALLSDAEGRPESLLIVLRDVSARRESQDRIRRQMNRLAALRTIDAAITGSLDLNVILRIILDEITNQLRLDAADCLLFHPHTQSLRLSVSRGFRATKPRTGHLSLTTGAAGAAALERRMVLLNDGAEIERNLGGRIDPAEQFRFYLATPLVAKGRILGVLEVFHRSPFTPDPDWIGFLETAAEQAAIAIDNAALFIELQRANTEITMAYDETIEGWSRAMDLRHRESEGHTLRVTDTTLRLARALNVPEEDLVHIRRGSLLHDIGKMEIPESVLLKKGPLTEEEWNIIRHHPVQAFELLNPIAMLRPAVDIPYCHHEKFDGSGYPRGLKRDQIPLGARLFAVVDVWDSLRAPRPYREAWTSARIETYLRSLEGAHFDPDVLRVFLEQVWPPSSHAPAPGPALP